MFPNALNIYILLKRLKSRNRNMKKGKYVTVNFVSCDVIIHSGFLSECTDFVIK